MRTLTLVMVALVLIFCSASHAAKIGGVAAQADVYQAWGAINTWCTVEYPETLLTWSFGADQVPDIVRWPGMVLHLFFTDTAGNWKEASVGLQAARKIPVELKDKVQGDVLTAVIPLEKLGAVRPGIYGITTNIGQRASYEKLRMIIIPLGKSSIYTKDTGLLRINFIEPLADPNDFPALPEIGPFDQLSQFESWLLYHNGGFPSIGQVNRDQVRRVLTTLINQPAKATPAKVPKTITTEPQVQKPDPVPKQFAQKPVSMEGPATKILVNGKYYNPQVKISQGKTLRFTFPGGQTTKWILSADGFWPMEGYSKPSGFDHDADYPIGTVLILQACSYDGKAWGPWTQLKVEVTK